MNFIFLILFGLGVIAVAAYFLSRTVFRKFNIKSEKNRKVYTVITTVILTPVICLILGFTVIGTVIFFENNSGNSYFSSYKWKEQPSKRQYMSQDLIRKNRLIGKTKEEVIEMLGEDFHYFDDSIIYYRLKRFPWLFSREPAILKIHFWNECVVEVTQSPSKPPHEGGFREEDREIYEIQ